jgi:hypothetical protein
MKNAVCFLFAALAVFHVGQAICGEPISTSNLTLVDENRAVLSKGEVAYQLDSYVVPFQQPYYVHVKRTDGKAMSKENAVGISLEYIRPRGCTEPPKRVEQLDRSNSDKSEWIVGVAC